MFLQNFIYFILDFRNIFIFCVFIQFSLFFNLYFIKRFFYHRCFHLKHYYHRFIVPQTIQLQSSSAQYRRYLQIENEIQNRLTLVNTRIHLLICASVLLVSWMYFKLVILKNAYLRKHLSQKMPMLFLGNAYYIYISSNQQINYIYFVLGISFRLLYYPSKPQLMDV